MAATASNSLSLKEYLKRYDSGANDAKTTKKKKKKKVSKPNSTTAGVLIVDEDPVWQKTVQVEESEPESPGEEEPQIEEDIEVKRMKRLEAIRARKPYHGISEDGSGWISVSEPPQESDSRENGPDLSPPRQRRRRVDTPSPERDVEPVCDPSPPRRMARQCSPSRGSPSGDLSPPRQVQHRSEDPDSDLSPPRRRRSQDADLSPPRRSRKGPDSDLSPPPRQVRRRSEDPERDLSPPRRRRSQDADLSPPRRRRKGPESDLSPPPRQVHRRPEDPERDLSPPRRRRSQDADLSPPRRSRKGPDSDLSPPRRRLNSQNDDLSPRSRNQKDQAAAKEGKAARAGLFSANEIKQELDRKKKEELSRFAAMDPSVSGRGAEPVFRDKEGKRISKEEKLKSKEPEEKPKEKKLEWGKGLAQQRGIEALARELELEKNKPFARTRDDPELDAMLKERVRWGDPMAHLVKRKHSELVLEDLGENEKMKESGFIVPQTIPQHSWLKRGLDFPPNRYGIRPGRHWDGVDRSNGSEKEFFKRQNEKRATESEAYLWSVSDM
ncbi:BUD13 homolog [Dioscorea cayenensis subsp. rotundata]|uniref:BUD13 homolog n=1 Tax=Dioscorea cayennensis subsp. rotundata TaxID=55577 RepID=A0AB40BGW7_DIOCR|nr:BUD13 homolog [Dioscorea cayenensis subsp. rotundata]